MGWEQFELIAQKMHIPVFALGGMTQEHLVEAQQHYAYGIAGLRFL